MIHAGSEWTLIREIDQIAGSIAADTVCRDGERFGRVIEDGAQIIAYRLECGPYTNARDCAVFTCHIKAVAWLLGCTYAQAAALYEDAEVPTGVAA